MNCFFHPDRTSISVCSVCGKGVCEDCIAGYDPPICSDCAAKGKQPKAANPAAVEEPVNLVPNIIGAIIGVILAVLIVYAETVNGDTVFTKEMIIIHVACLPFLVLAFAVFPSGLRLSNKIITVPIGWLAVFIKLMIAALTSPFAFIADIVKYVKYRKSK